ncbi:hypothetical protein EMCRGX_G012541 [Ephydatia muelleri]
MIVVLARDHYGLVELGCNGLNIYNHSKRCTETRYAPVASVVTYSNHCLVHKCNVHWTGDSLTVSVNVESLPNAPLDLYILMDLSDSMAAPLATVKSISQLIAQQVSSITTNVRIGFGAFNDKPIYPYSPQTPAGCLPGRDAPDCSDRRAGTRQYSFLHLANFTSNFSVPNVFVTTNLDLPESSFDALVQVLACEQELGWRNRSVEGPERGLQRLVLLITDNQPHLAGDGRLAGIYQPNDGRCHVRPYNSSVGYLDTAPGILIYNEDSLLYDYPSVGLVASLLKKYDVIPIFGIVPMINNTFLSSYQALQDLMTSVGTKAFARPISSSASGVLDVIKTVYQEVIQNIAITLPTQSDVAVSLSQINCPNQPCVNNGTCDSATGMCQCTDYTGLFSNGSLLVNVSKLFSNDSLLVNMSRLFSNDSLLVNMSRLLSNDNTSGILLANMSRLLSNDSTSGILLPPYTPKFTGSTCSCTNFQNCPTNSQNYICSDQQVAKTCVVSGNCTYGYDLSLDNQVISHTNPECSSKLEMIIIPAVICGLLFLFVIICAIIKIILVMLDYVEVKRWEQGLKEANFSKNQNPLYQSPEMQYTNVVYGKTM